MKTIRVSVCLKVLKPEMNILTMPSELSADGAHKMPVRVDANWSDAVPGAMSLCDLPRGQSATISSVMPATEEDRELVLRLIEIGFIPGEKVRVIAHGHPGREPIALRIGGASGGASFALRRFEANYIRVIPDSTPPMLKVVA